MEWVRKERVEGLAREVDETRSLFIHLRVCEDAWRSHVAVPQLHEDLFLGRHVFELVDELFRQAHAPLVVDLICRAIHEGGATARVTLSEELGGKSQALLR